MSQPNRPTLAWTLAVWALLAAAVLGLVAWIYARYYDHELTAAWMPIPEHIHWITWFGIILMLLGGLGALAMLVLRHRRVAS